MKSIVLLAVFLLPFAVVQAQVPVKRILLEEFSTAPCGFCPDGDIIAEKLARDHPQIIWVTHHAGFGNDAMTLPESKSIASIFTDFAPAGVIDRGDHPVPIYTRLPYIAVARQRWDSVCTAHLGDTAVVEISVHNSFNRAARTLSSDVDVRFFSAPVPGDFRISLFIVEDSVVGTGWGYDQTNYYNTTASHPCYNRGDPIVGYAHRRVIRAILGGTWGVTGVIPATPEMKTYTHSFNDIPLLAEWNVDALDVVAFVSYHAADAKKRNVLNSNSARVAGATSVDDNPAYPEAAGFEVFPSPVSDLASVRFASPLPHSARLVIHDALGRSAGETSIAAGSSVATIPTRHLPAGLYFVRLQGSAGPGTTARVLIAH